MAFARRMLTSHEPSATSPLGYHAYVPQSPTRRPPLVLVHGSSRSSSRLFRAYLPAAIALGVPLLAPRFTSDAYAGYQRLRAVDEPMGALVALEATLDEAASRLGAPTGQVDIAGYSGGAQFTHRFAMASPQRVRRAVVASAGWYTYLDQSRPFPSGCGASASSGGRVLDVDGFLAVPIHLLVGERDTTDDAALRRSPGLDRRQGTNRLDRALRWIDHVETVARQRGAEPRISFDLLPHARHGLDDAVRHGGLVARSLAFLHGQHLAGRDAAEVQR